MSPPIADFGIPPSTVTHMIVRKLVERDPAGLAPLTDQGSAVLKALIRIV